MDSFTNAKIDFDKKYQQRKTIDSIVPVHGKYIKNIAINIQAPIKIQ